MRQKIYIVSYSSNYDEIYNEVKPCKSVEETEEVINGYLNDIAESIDNDSAENIPESDTYDGATYQFRCTDCAGHEFLVEATAHEIEF